MNKTMVCIKGRVLALCFIPFESRETAERWLATNKFSKESDDSWARNEPVILRCRGEKYKLPEGIFADVCDLTTPEELNLRSI